MPENIPKWFRIFCRIYSANIAQSAMVPQLTHSEDILEFIPDDEKENFHGAKYAIRLSMPGYLDCTEWAPVYTKHDFSRFFQNYVSMD